MRSWFIKSTVTTDDPLAAITVDCKGIHVYAVNRVNPIFVEEDDDKTDEERTRSQLNSKKGDQGTTNLWPSPHQFAHDNAGYKGFDFTMDGYKAERLLRKLKLRKQKRCWCHLITAFVGLFVFLLSMIMVSLLLTRGKRMFGSL